MNPTEEIIGVVGFSNMTVRPGDTCVVQGVGDLPIISASQLVHLMEHAAVVSLDEYLATGETTIAISIEIISLSPAQIGAELRATSRCIDIENKELTFECEVYEGQRQIAAAIIKRATVERVSFLARTAAQSIKNL